MPSAFFARHARKIAVLAGLAALALAGLAIMHAQGMTPAMVFAKLKDVAQWAAGKNPVFYVLALTLLPYAGVPSSFLYMAAGAAYGTVEGTLLSLCGLALNLPLGYLVGKFWLRAPIARMLEKRGHRILEVPPGEFTRLIVLMRVIPGPPLVIQNFLLAMAGTPFLPYYLISLPLTLFFAAGILLTSGALLEGNTKLVAAGVGLVIAVTLLAHIVKTMHQAKNKNGPKERPSQPE
ncbi:MAG TPA: VTT domain-containing protein [Opitutales bacterium]|nr:VTT domain-containing protein [Opitutales bacterium]